METVLSRSASSPHCVVTDHGSRRGRASWTVSRAGRPAAVLPHSVPNRAPVRRPEVPAGTRRSPAGLEPLART